MATASGDAATPSTISQAEEGTAIRGAPSVELLTKPLTHHHVDQRRPSKAILEHALSTFTAKHKHGYPWYRPTWDKIVRLLQLLTTLDITIPIAMMYDNGSICPYAILCANGPVEIALLFVAKISATLMYVPLTIIILSKCATFRAFVQSIYIAEVIDLYGLHEMHTNFGLEVAMYATLHVLSHIIRLSLHNHRLFLDGGQTVNSGYPVAVCFLLLIPPFACEFIKKRLSFEVRKSLHMLAIPAFIALAFHHQRLRYFAGILLVAYGLDWVYSNVVKTYRVQQPYLFPIGTSGTVIEFLPPPGFKFASGQYLFVCVPYLSKYQWHPFSVIPATTADGSLACSLYALSCGDWTEKLLEAAKRNVRRPIWINGAHPSPFDTSIKFDYLFLICTGIGITPGISVISQYCYSKVIVLIWVCRDQDLINAYSDELQVVNTKVFYTGKGKQQEGGGPRVEGNVMYCTGRPDMCREIKNVILKKRPLDWAVNVNNNNAAADPNATRPAVDATEQQRDMTLTGPMRRTNPNARKLPLAEGGGQLQDPRTTFILPGKLEAGLAEANTTVRPSGGNAEQPFRRAMMDLYHVDRQDDVEHTEWLVLYCGNSAQLGKTLSTFCRERGIHFKTEFFGSW